jgi:hypothetical protein
MRRFRGARIDGKGVPVAVGGVVAVGVLVTVGVRVVVGDGVADGIGDGRTISGPTPGANGIEGALIGVAVGTAPGAWELNGAVSAFVAGGGGPVRS